jgi:hypothetical protein
MNHQTRPRRTPANPAMEVLMRWVSGTGRGQALGHWLSRTIALPQLRRLTTDAIPPPPFWRRIYRAGNGCREPSDPPASADQAHGVQAFSPLHPMSNVYDTQTDNHSGDSNSCYSTAQSEHCTACCSAHTDQQNPE